MIPERESCRKTHEKCLLAFFSGSSVQWWDSCSHTSLSLLLNPFFSSPGKTSASQPIKNSHQPITVSRFQLTKVITRWQRTHQIAALKVLGATTVFTRVHIHLNHPLSRTTFSANVISSVIGWKLKPLAFKSERLQTHPPLQPLQCHFPPCYIKGVPCTFLICWSFTFLAVATLYFFRFNF